MLFKGKISSCVLDLVFVVVVVAGAGAAVVFAAAIASVRQQKTVFILSRNLSGS